MKARQPARWKRTALNTAVSIAIASFTPMVMAASQTISDAQTTGITLTGPDSVTITSTGSISTSGSSAAAIGLSPDAGGATIVNNGEIQAGGYRDAYGITTFDGGELSGTINNGSSGSISAQAMGGSSSQASAAGIRVGDVSHAGTAISNSGSISAEAMSDSSGAFAVGISTGDLTGAGTTISNVGTISSSATAGSSGYSGAGAFGIFASGLEDNTHIINSGSVSASAIGEGSSLTMASGIAGGGLLGKGASITNNADATIDVFTGNDGGMAWAKGMSVYDGLDTGAVINNLGTINVEAALGSSSGSGYALANGIYGGDLGNNARLLNSGNITVSASSEADTFAMASGMSASGLGSGASITNAAGGMIDVTAESQGDSASAVGIRFRNAGSSSSGSSALSPIGISTSVSSSGAVISNLGTISASAHTYGNGSSSNQGANAAGIAGAYLGEGSRILNSGSITVSAQVEGQEGDARAIGISLLPTSSSGPILRSIGPGSLMGAGSSITNSGTISVNATSTVTAPGQASAAGIYLPVLGESASILNSGSITTSAVAEGEDSDARACGICVFPASSSGPILRSIGPDAVMGAGSSIANSGTIKVSAVNSASDYGRASAAAIYAVGMGENARILNSGIVQVTAQGYIDSYAQASGMTAEYLDSGASIVNDKTGTITVVASSEYESAEASGIGGGYLGTDSSLANKGVITVSATSTDADASAYGIYSSYMDDGAGISNSGTINVTATAGSQASAYGIYVGEGVGTGASISNSGGITAQAISHASDSSAYAYGIGVDGGLSDNATITNSGNITATAYHDGEYDAYAYGIGVDGGLGEGASVVNAKTGTITVNANQHSGYDASAYGIYVSSGLYGNGAAVTNNGTVGVTAISASGTASAYGIYIGGLDGDTSVANTGSIDATARSNDSDAYAYGIRTGSLGGAYTTTSGTGDSAVEIQYSGASISNSGNINVLAKSYDYASAYGIEAGSLGNHASISNSGSLIVSAESDFSSAYAYGIYTSDLDEAASITNKGKIEVSATGSWYAYAYGIYADGSLGESASIANSGTIKATAHSTYEEYAEAYGIYVNGSLGAGARIVNSGTITAAAQQDLYYGAYAYGIYAGDLESALTSMTSDGATVVTTPGASISNTGTISVLAKEVYDSYASAYGIYAGELGDGASISNSGKITVLTTKEHSYSANAYGIYSGSLGGGASISNSGTIDVTANENGSSYAYAYGIDAGSLNGERSSIVNSGKILVSAYAKDEYASATGIRAGNLNGSGSAIVNSGTINAAAATDYSDAYAFGIYTGRLSGAYSTSSGSGADLVVTQHPAASISNSGKILATAKVNAAGFGEAFGIYTDELDDYASITNTKTGNILASLVAGGDATSAHGSAYGLYLDGGMGVGASISNAGRIVASADAVGDSSAYAYGIELYGGDMAREASISNSGTITAAAHAESSAYAYGIYLYGFVSGDYSTTAGTGTSAVVTQHPGASISNSGTIVATAEATKYGYASAHGIYVYDGISGNLINSGKITATAEAANASSAYGYGINSYYLDGSLENSGSIVATASQANQAWSLYFESGTGTVDNTGTLVGNLYLGGTISMTNDGAVLLPTGAMGESQAYVGGNYTQGANGILGIGATSTTQYAQLYVGGDADISASNRLAVLVSKDNTLAKDEVLTNVLQAGDTLTTDTSKDISVIDNSVTLNFTAELNGSNGIDLTAHSAGFDSLAGAVGSGSGLSGAAAALEKMLNANSDNPLLQGFFGLNSSADAVNAVKQASPTSGVGRSVLNTLHGSQHIIGARQDALRGQASGDDFVTDKEVWFKPFGSKADQDDANGTPGYSADTYGLAIGADGELSAGNRIGAAFTYAHSKVDANGVAQSTTVNIYQGAVYGSYNLDAATFVDYQADLGINKNESKRSVGTNADYDSLSTHVGAGLGRMYSLNSQTVFTPSVHLDYANVDNSDYTESGPGPLILRVNSNNADELILAVDGKVDYSLNDSSKLTANLGMGYDALADQDSLTAAFAGTPNTAFTVKGAEPSDWIARGGVGYVMTNAKSTQVSARYDVDLRDGYTNQTVSLKLMMPF